MSSDDRAVVPCGECRLCCKMMTLLQQDKGDDIASYDFSFFLTGGKMMPVLTRKANGDCIYLAEAGCSIHDRAPFSCRRFDCREVWRNSDRNGRRAAMKKDPELREIFARGRELTEMQE